CMRYTILRWRAGGTFAGLCPVADARRWGRSPLPRAPDREAFHLQGRLADAHRDALPVLAARPDAVVQLQVIAHHGHPGQHVGAVADERGALQRGADTAVFDGVRLAGGEDELARGDVHLAAAEVDGIDAARHGADDLLGI